jgi:tRNA (guanine37-N1)-methyltransferase
MTPSDRQRAQAPRALSTAGVNPPANRWRASVLTLFPEMFPGPLGLSLAGKALREDRWSLEAADIRGFATDRHRTVDDTPFGGGAGMVMRPDIVDAAVESASAANPGAPVIYLTPRGRLLDQGLVRELAAGPGLVLLCGRYEGVDQRVVEARGMVELSVGDFVLSGGEPAALLLLDACVRLLPGVMGASASGEEESHGPEGLLEYPHYTRPAEWQGRKVPEVLLSGHHAEVARWRRERAEETTRTRRPDLWNKHLQRNTGEAGRLDGHPTAA